MQTTDCYISIEEKSNAAHYDPYLAITNLLSRARLYESSGRHTIANGLRLEACRLQQAIMINHKAG